MYGSKVNLKGGALLTLRSYWHLRGNVPLDEIPEEYELCCSWVKKLIIEGDVDDVVAFLEHSLRQSTSNYKAMDRLIHLFEKLNQAFRVIEKPYTIVRIASEEHAEAIKSALKSAPDGSGPYKHLMASAERLTAGAWGDAIEESVHAVEARVLPLASELKGGNVDSFSNAIAEITQALELHPALGNAMSALWGWASNEPGVRHSLYKPSVGRVDESTALFANHICASFLNLLDGLKADELAATEDN